MTRVGAADRGRSPGAPRRAPPRSWDRPCRPSSPRAAPAPLFSCSSATWAGALQAAAAFSLASCVRAIFCSRRERRRPLRRRLGISSRMPVLSATLPSDERVAGRRRGGRCPSRSASEGVDQPAGAAGRPAEAAGEQLGALLGPAGALGQQAGAVAASAIPPRTWPTPPAARARLRPTRPTFERADVRLRSRAAALPCSRSGSTASETRAGPITACTPGSLAIRRCQRLSASRPVGLGDRPVVGGGDDDEGGIRSRGRPSRRPVRCRGGPGRLGELLGARRARLQRQRRAGEEQDDAADRDRDRRRPAQRRRDDDHQARSARRRARGRSASGRGSAPSRVRSAGPAIVATRTLSTTTSADGRRQRGEQRAGDDEERDRSSRAAGCCRRRPSSGRRCGRVIAAASSGSAPGRQLLAEARDHQQGVVDARAPGPSSCRR